MLAAGGRTDDPYLTALITVRHIYEQTGMIVEPWNVGEFPSDWMDAIKALRVDVPAKAAKINRVKHGKS